MNEDRERTLFAAAVAAFGAVAFIAGTLVSWPAGLFTPWGCVLLVLGALAVLDSLLVGLGITRSPEPGTRNPERRPSDIDVDPRRASTGGRADNTTAPKMTCRQRTGPSAKPHDTPTPQITSV